ncbi:OmpA/MotB family protein [Selenomonas massiliensis]|uniref:OmpA/MotB family protein n=1 Tax=Selenomonas massiliensis TaxID=2058293 RepID=UPI000D0EE925|nr:OmpA family protein [Selenomonas massiliensis]
MQVKRNPWISITDLFSSVVLVVLLLFVMAAIVPKFTQEAQRREMMEKIESALTVYEEQGQVKVHSETGMLEFTSVTFDSGSAELTPETKLLVKDLSANLTGYMAENPMMELLIEGHTDPAMIHTVVNRGGYFADNIQLSTLRAANVRRELLASMGTEYANRIGVAGYGDTRLKNIEQPLSAENRRIEIRILWKGQGTQ